jgi:alkylhydroperoxidase family enzyme
VVIDSTWITNAEADLQANRDQQQELDALRTAHTTQLELSDFTSESAAIQALAQKIIWLEAEVRQLRGE